MVDLQEVIFTSDTSGQLCSSCVWDPHAGTALMSYKGGGSAVSKTLNLVGNDYIASVEQNKPLMHIWPLNSNQPLQSLRMVLPGKANSVAFSPDAKFCVAGFDEKIYLWQVNTGRLLTILSRHFQNVTCLKFCDDGSHFISAAEDGIVMIWCLATLVCHPVLEVTSQSVAGQHDPWRILSDHSLPVMDIFIGKDGIKGHLVTVSIDRSCRIYEMATGELLLNIIFDGSLTSVTMDAIEINLFVGTSEGNIYQLSLMDPPRNRDHYVNKADTSIKAFTGHSKGIVSLSVSADGVTLMSGSLDEQVFLWHIPSRRKIRLLPHKGPVSNAFFAKTVHNLFTDKFNPSVVIRNFQRTQDNNSDSVIEVLSDSKEIFWTYEELKTADVSTCISSSSGTSAEVDSLKIEIDRLKKINGELYTFATHKIIDSVIHVTAPKKKCKKSKNKMKNN